MRGRRVITLVVVLVAAAAVLGCGQSEEAASFETYINDLRPHLEQFSADALPAVKEINNIPADATTDDVAVLTDEVAAAMSTFASGLQSVEPYPEMATEHEGAANAMNESAEAFDRLSKLLRHMEAGDHSQAELEAHMQELDELSGSLDALDPPLNAFDSAITRISKDLGVSEPDWWSKWIEEWEKAGS